MTYQLEQDIQELTKYSDRNIKTLRDDLGPETVALARSLIEKHPRLFTTGLFHETSAENIESIQKDGFVYSFDDLRKMQKEHKPGLTYPEKTLCEIFNTVAHAPDPYLEFVYSRPHFGGKQALSASEGFYLETLPLTPATWISFVDPNQTTFNDKYYIEMGMSIVKSFSSSDVYVGDAIYEALALKALSYIANADYIQRLNEVVYDADLKAHLENPQQFRKPKDSAKMTFEECLDMYITSGYQTVEDRNACAVEAYTSKAFGPYGDLLRDAGLGLTPRGARLSPDIVKRPDFDAIFEQTLEAIFKDIARHGQIAVPEKLDITQAETISRAARKTATPQQPSV